RPGAAGVQPGRRRLAAERLRPRARRAAGLAPARLRAGSGLPGDACVASGTARAPGRCRSAAMTAALRPPLEAGLAALGLAPALADPLLAYLALLQRWNATYSLTAIRDPRQMVELHLLDSLAMAPHVAGLPDLADLGTGP